MTEWLTERAAYAASQDWRTFAIVGAVLFALASLRSCASSLEAIREMMAYEDGERARKRAAERAYERE